MDISRQKATQLFIDFLQLDWIGKNICGIAGDIYDCTDYVPYCYRNLEESSGDKVAYYNEADMQFCTELSWLFPMIGFIEDLGYGTELVFVPKMGYRLQFYKDGVNVISTYWFSTKLQCMWNSCAEFIIYYNTYLLNHASAY